MTEVSPGAPHDRFKQAGASDSEDGALQLGAYVGQIWAYKVEILVVVLVCAVAAVALAALGSRKYQAQISVMVSQSKLDDRNGTNVPVPISTFRPLLESKDVAASVIQELGLDKPPRSVAISTFFTNVATLEQVRDSPVITLTVELDDPALAARAANLIAERAVSLSRGVSQREAVRVRDDLQQQRDDAKSRMEQATEALRKFQEASQVELVRKDVESMLVQRGELLALLIQIETEKARLATAERELAGRDRIATVKRTIDSDPALMEAARRATDPNSSLLLTLETRNEFVNSVYDGLDGQIATSRTTLAALERRKTQIVDVRKLDAPQAALLTRVYGLESELTRLTVERDLATAVYRQVATAYETARVQVASRSAQLEILDRAVAPDRPVSRHIVRNGLIGMLLGLVFALIGAVVHSNLSKARPTAPISGGA